MKNRASLLVHAVLVMQLIASPIFLNSATKKQETVDAPEAYTINFDNVPIQEFLKFISKIAGVNVIYNDSDMNFNVTIVSEETTDLNNVLSALVQILRIHGLTLIEEEKNLLIHKNNDVRQIPTVVSIESPLKGKLKPAIMTKVFKIQKGNPSHIASLIIPMLSKDALVEVSSETRQLIITDVSSSIQTIEQLLLSLDAPETPYDVDAFAPKFGQVVDLATLAKKILAPIADSTTLEIIPQQSTQTIYIVSTPFLIDKTIAVLQDLDKQGITTELSLTATKNLSADNVLVYKLHHKSPEDAESDLKKMVQAASNQSFESSGLILALSNMKYIQSTNSLMFVGAPHDLDIIGSFLKSIDNANTRINQQSSFLVYNIKHATEEQLRSSLHNLADYLETGKTTSQDLILAIDSMRWIKATNSLLFTGQSAALKELSDLLPSFDVTPEKSRVTLTQTPLSTEFLIYNPKQTSAAHLKTLILETAARLKSADLSDPAFMKTLESVKELPSSNQLIFTGDKASLERLMPVIQNLDQRISTSVQMNESPAKEVIFIPVLHRSAKEIVSILRETANTISKTINFDSSLVQTLKSADFTPNGNTIILSGSPQNVQKAQELITSNDVEPKTSVNPEVFVYKIRYLSTQELKTALLGIADHADNSNPSSETNALLQSINSMRTIPESNAVQFTAIPSTIAKLKDIILILDVPENAKSQIKQQLGTNFLVYKVKNLNPQDLLTNLRQIVKEAPNQDTLLKSVAGAQYSAGSNSIVFTGNSSDLSKIQTLLETLDQGMPQLESKGKITPIRQAEGYKIYKPTHVPGLELIAMVKNFEEHLVASGVTDQNLGEVIDHLSYLDRTNTLIVTGKDAEIEQVVGLLREFDTLETATGKGGKMFESGVETIDDTGFLIYKLQHQSGVGIVQALTVISSDLGTQTSQKKNTSLVEAIRSTQWIEPTNSLIATGQPRVLTKLRELIESIDQPLKQVFIEILVVQSNNGDDLEFGLSWGSQGAVHNRFSWGGGNYSSNDITNSAAGTGFPQGLDGITATTLPNGQNIPPVLGGFLGVIGDVIWHKGKSYASLGSLIKAFRTVSTTTEVLSQKIVAQDNQNAKIFSGQNIPFTGSLVTTSGLSQTTNANLEYRNVGVTLSITPIIGDNDIITLDIDFEMSEEANQGTGSGSNITQTQANSINGITTTKTSMQTKVHMPDRHFLVLSGTIDNSSARINNGIPCLGGLPLIGAAFSLNNNLISNSSVIVFVKPHIIKSEQIYGKITKEQEEIFGNKNQTCPDDFQNGLELIRSADDIDNEDTE